MVFLKKLIYLSLLAALVLVVVTDVAAECKGDEFNDEDCRKEDLIEEDEDADDEAQETLAFDQWGEPLPGHVDPPDLYPPASPDSPDPEQPKSRQAPGQPSPPNGPPMNPPSPPNNPPARPPPPPYNPPARPPPPPNGPPMNPALPPNNHPGRPLPPLDSPPMNQPPPPDDYPMGPPPPPNGPPMRPPWSPNGPPMRPPWSANRPPMRPPWSQHRPPMRPPWSSDTPWYISSSRSVTRAVARLPADCGRPGTSLRSFRGSSFPRIFSGYDARDAQFPSFVQLHLKGANQAPGTVEVCGGTIISPDHILTAAHCMEKKVATETLIGPGIGGVRAALFQGTLLRAQKHCISPLYHKSEYETLTKPFVSYDVAIIKLQRPIKFTSKIQPACLPQQPLQFQSQQAYSIGMGTTYKDPRTNMATMANSLKVLPVTRTQCDAQEQHVSLLCAQGNDQNNQAGKVCPGDSGGPVMGLDSRGRQTVYGLHSYGAGMCMDYRKLHASLPASTFLKVKCADVLNIRSEIDKLLAECA